MNQDCTGPLTGFSAGGLIRSPSTQPAHSMRFAGPAFAYGCTCASGLLSNGGGTRERGQSTIVNICNILSVFLLPIDHTKRTTNETLPMSSSEEGLQWLSALSGFLPTRTHAHTPHGLHTEEVACGEPLASRTRASRTRARISRQWIHSQIAETLLVFIVQRSGNVVWGAVVWGAGS